MKKYEKFLDSRLFHYVACGITLTGISYILNFQHAVLIVLGLILGELQYQDKNKEGYENEN